MKLFSFERLEITLLMYSVLSLSYCWIVVARCSLAAMLAVSVSPSKVRHVLLRCSWCGVHVLHQYNNPPTQQARQKYLLGMYLLLSFPFDADTFISQWSVVTTKLEPKLTFLTAYHWYSVSHTIMSPNISNG